MIIFDKEIASLASVILGMSIEVPYVLVILKGRVRPHFFSWLVWTFISAVSATIQYMNGGGVGVWFLIYHSILLCSVTVLSLRYGTKDIHATDWVSLFFCGVAILFWIFMKDPLPSLLLMLTIDGCAYYPTARKSWKAPEEEAAFSWYGSGFASLLSIYALQTYSLATYLYPSVIATLNIGLGCMLLIRRRFVVKH